MLTGALINEMLRLGAEMQNKLQGAFLFWFPS